MKEIRFMSMAPLIIAGLCAASVSQASILYSENFDEPDGQFIGSPEVNYNAEIGPLEAHGALQNVSGNQLSSADRGGLRFGGETERFNWASGTVGSVILADGGFSVSFDWTPTPAEGDHWIGFKVGTPNGDRGAVDAATDNLFIMKDSGTLEAFKGDVNFINAANAFAADPFHNVTLTYALTDFNLGSTVDFTVNVDGSDVASDSFLLSRQNDVRMEILFNNPGEGIDNFVVQTIPEPTTFGLLGAFGVGMLFMRRRLKR